VRGDGHEAGTPARLFTEGEVMAKDRYKATIKHKGGKASNGKQTKAELQADVAQVLDTLGMEETDSRHGMKTYKSK
jgi:DNA-directed RNA polymerase subunit N (RpoN/RPB10)